MKRFHRGFTIIELLVVIVILGILMTVAFVSMRFVEASGRNAERKSDAEAIALTLESYYKQGAADGSHTGQGQYPSTTTVTDSLSNTQLNYIQTNLLPDSNASVFRFSFLNSTPTPYNLKAATSVSSPSAPPSNENYITYEPLYYTGSTWALCTGTNKCTRFNLHYTLEASGSSGPATTTITSKNQ